MKELPALDRPLKPSVCAPLRSHSHLPLGRYGCHAVYGVRLSLVLYLSAARSHPRPQTRTAAGRSLTFLRLYPRVLLGQPVCPVRAVRPNHYDGCRGILKGCRLTSG
jgi:hypothetical protein